MRKGIFSIWSVLLVLVVSIAVLVPSCIPTGTIKVEATRCGKSWTGEVGYRLEPWEPGAPFTGTSVPGSFGVFCDTYTCQDVTGGPDGAHLVGITPGTVTVSQGETETFTLEFELDQDASIEFVTWTIDGWPVQGVGNATSCQIIYAEYQQWVNGCPGYNVTVNETSWLKITQTSGAPAQIFVFNDDCALNKAAEPPAESPEKVSQNTTLEGDFVNPGGEPIPLTLEVPVNLDVETIWQLVKCLNYTKSINWFGISEFEPLPHECVLFELVVPGPGFYQFTLQTSASVALVDDVDVHPDNNSSGWSSPLDLIVWVL